MTMMQTDILGTRPRGFNQWFLHCGPGYQSRHPDGFHRRDGRSPNQGHAATRLDRTTSLERERRRHHRRAKSSHGDASWTRSTEPEIIGGRNRLGQRWASTSTLVRRHGFCIPIPANNPQSRLLVNLVHSFWMPFLFLVLAYPLYCKRMRLVQTGHAARAYLVFVTRPPSS